jgi:CHAD domain-containing protein
MSKSRHTHDPRLDWSPLLTHATWLYELAQPLSRETLTALVPEGYTLHEARSAHVTRTYLDTFDWRLYERGQVMEAVEDEAGTQLIWRTLVRGVLLGTQPVVRIPRVAADLPIGAVGAHLAELLDIRALLPMATVCSEVQGLSLRDAEDKTQLRLEVRSERRGRGAASIWLWLLPVRGYEAIAAAVLAGVQRIDGIRSGEDPFALAMAEVGRTPGDYSPKIHLELDPAERADAAGKRILLDLLDTLRRNEDGMRQDLDSEFLHDYRVTVRRTRSFLAQVKHVFPAQRVARFRREFAWLQEITGASRDMDVYLLTFAGFKADLPETEREALEPFRAFLVAHKAQSHRALVAAMDSARYGRVLRDWQAFLAAPVPAHTTLANAMRPIVAVAGERIDRLHRRAVKEGRAIGPGSPPEVLHELRKTCKKLRYLMEFFRSLYPEAAIAELIKALKQLQDNLGAYQDLHVQELSLARFLETMRTEGELPPATEAAMQRLIGVLHDRQAGVRDEFAARFADFDTGPVRKRFKALFAPAPLAEPADG